MSDHAQRKPAAGHVRAVYDDAGEVRFVDYGKALLPGDQTVDIDGRPFRVKIA